MRNAFADEVTKLGQSDPRIVLLSGDIGNKLFDDFKEKCPGRFLNCGIGEANMMGVAAGLALSGLRPVVYTITPFTTTRCFEQIRVDVCYHNLPVVIAGTGSGLAYAELGPTHHSCEDIAILRTLPHMTVFCPGDPLEMRLGLRAAFSQQGPVYVRLGKKGEATLHKETPDLVLGKSLTLRTGDDLCLISTGTLLESAMAAAGLLEKANISARVESFHTVKPLDHDTLTHLFNTFRLVVTIEEHGRIGGLGSAVGEWLAERNLKSPPNLGGNLFSLGVDDRFLHEVGSQDYARRQFGLGADQIASSIQDAWNRCAARSA